MMQRTVLLFFAFFFITAATAENAFYEEQKKGWHWYDVIPVPLEEDESEEIVEVEPSPAIIIERKEDPQAELEKLKETVETAKAKAVLEPSPENVKAYIELQNAVQDQAAVFARTWQTVLWANPELDKSLTKPTNQTARKIFNDQHQVEKAAAIQQWAQTHGLFYFFRSDCPYCQAFAPVLKQFEATYGVNIIAISLDGKTLPEYPEARTDNGAAERLGVSTVPALFAVDPSTQEVTPITFGLISMDDLSERLWHLSVARGEVLYE